MLSTPYIRIDMVKLTDMFYQVPIVSACQKQHYAPTKKKKVPFKDKYRLENTLHIEDGCHQKYEVV
jgi:hypothetical protein